MAQWIWSLVLIELVAFTGLAHAAEAPSTPPALDGNWVGAFERSSGEPAAVDVRIEDSSATARIAITIRSERIRGARAKDVTVDSDRLSFRLDAEGQERDFELRRTGDQFDGHLNDRHSNRRFDLHLQKALKFDLDHIKQFVGDYRTPEGDLFFIGYSENLTNRANPLVIYVTWGDRLMQIVPVGESEFVVDSGARIAFDLGSKGPASRLRWHGPQKMLRVAERIELYREEEVSFNSPGARLSGTLYLPTTPAPHPALVFVHGSGPQERLSNWWMADRFARSGIACLSYDKRGTGKSTGDWHPAGFDVLADDVLAGVELVRARPEMIPNKVGLWGVSQAAWIIPLAASRSDHVAFCIPVSGGAVCPAEQELWRRTEYLRFFGCSPVLQNAMRRGVAMHFQWEQLFKDGRFPIPPLFETEALDMYHDAPAVIRQVHQPVLAIFGEMDRLTPPKESAAIWAHELKAAGNRDYSVRVFPRATHGLLETDRTGNPFEVLPESRLAPGYLKIMLDWIGDHVRATGSPRNVIDVGTEDVVESRGMRELPWYGSLPVQVPLMFACMLGSVLAIVGWPAAWLVRKIRNVPRPPESRRGPIITSWFVHFVALGMCVAILALLRFLGDTSPSTYYRWAEIDWWILAGLTLGIGWFAVSLIRTALHERRAKRLSRPGQALLWITAVTACLWIPFFMYWTWGPLFSS